MDTIMQKTLEDQLFKSSRSQYGIYRLIRSKGENRFRGLEELRQDGIEPSKHQYALTHIGELHEGERLDDIFYLLNMEHPEDYLCPSLSVGDVVVINQNGKLSAHFVDRIGFADLPLFLEQPLNNDTNASPATCQLCRQELKHGETLCTRCTTLHHLLGEHIDAGRLLDAFWEGCFQCEAEIVASVELTPDNLTIQCDNCGEIHVIPFTTADLRRYIRSGIVREMVSD